MADISCNFKITSNFLTKQWIESRAKYIGSTYHLNRDNSLQLLPQGLLLVEGMRMDQRD